MTDDIFEARLADRLRARAAEATRPFDASAIARFAVAPMPRRRSVLLEWAALPRGLRWALVAAALAGLLVAIAVGGPFRERVPWSTGGVSNGWIIYALKGFERTSDSNIYVVRPGAEARLLIGSVGDKLSQQCPTFSPDGTRLAYLESRASGSEVVVTRFDVAGVVGGEDLRTYMAGAWLGCPRWAPDGRGIAYSATSSRLRLWFTRLDGTESELFVLPDSDGLAEFDWAPDGTEVVVAAGRDLVIIPVGGDEPRVAYTGASDITLSGPIWSPDGKRIVVRAQRVTQLSESTTVEDLPWRIISVDNSAPPIELADLEVESPAWSPDGKRLAFVRTTRPQGVHEIMAVTPDGREPTVLASDTRDISGLVWSPDGTTLLYSANARSFAGRGYLMTIPTSGSSGPVPLTRPHEFGNPTALVTWQPLFGGTLSEHGVPTLAPGALSQEWPAIEGDRGPGLYSWDMATAIELRNQRAGGIRLTFALDGFPYDGTGIPTTVGGYAARMRWLVDGQGLRSEQWVIDDVGGRTLFITLQESPGSDEFDFFEARRVVESIFFQGGPTPDGIRLFFGTDGGWSPG